MPQSAVPAPPLTPRRRSSLATTMALLLAAALVALPWVVASGATAPSAASDAPVLLITDPAGPFSRYYAEILRAEGLNDFDVADLATVNAAALADHIAVLLAADGVTAAQAAMLDRLGERRRQPDRDAPRQRSSAPLLGLAARRATLARRAI